MRHTERTIKARAVECKKKQVQSLAELVSLAERISVLGGIDGGRTRAIPAHDQPMDPSDAFIRQPCSLSGGSPDLPAICWQTLAISVRTSNTTRSMLRRIATESGKPPGQIS